MSPGGHRATALVVGVAGGIVYLQAGAMLEAALWLGAALLGGRAPDWLEVVYGRSAGRRSLIPHRTLTHWVLGWGILTYLAWTWIPPGNEQVVVMGFLATVWLHLLYDMMTPSGIPLLFPFGQRTSLGIYTTGSVPAESALIVVTIVAAALLILLSPISVGTGAQWDITQQLMRFTA